jgi:tetratricopeptide (TPR) repeat protein
MLPLLAYAVVAFQSSCIPPEQKAIVALPSGTIIQNVGTCDLPVSTRSDKAKKLVHQGFALIHCFWFNEAVRSFRDAAKEDPACGLAWMGLNASLTLPWHRPGTYAAEADYAIKKAVEVCGDESPLEQSLIAAFRLRSARVDDRESEFERAMERLIQDNPNAIEPRLLISAIRVQLCLGNGYDTQGDLRKEMKKVLAWIEPILKKDPNNAGALHYKIHAWESTDASKALDAANRLGPAASGSSHMVHMPGHIYNRLGMYETAQKAFKWSQDVDDQYIARMPGATTSANWNYSHNMDYMAANLVEMGRLKDAHAALDKVEITHESVQWRAGQWKELGLRDDYFAGWSALDELDIPKADASATKLEKVIQKEPGKLQNWALTQRRVSEVKALELRGAILSTQAKHEEAIAKLRKAVEVFGLIAYDEPPHYSRLPHETLGQALLRAGQYTEAERAYKDGLFFRPNSGWLLYGVAQAREKQGDVAATRAAYQAFLEAWKSADPDLPQVVHAKAILAATR